MVTRVVLGSDATQGRSVAIEAYGRARSTYIIGKTGMGKSVLLEEIAYQDMVNGDGLILIDPHEDLANALVEVVPQSRRRDVIFWDTADRRRPFCLNPFYCSEREFTDKTVGNFLAALESLKDFAQAFENAPHMRDVLRHLAIAFVVNQGRTLIEAPAFLTNEEVRETFYPRLAGAYPWVLEYWEDFDQQKRMEQRAFVASSLNKLRPFATDKLMRAIFGGRRNAIDFRLAMDRGTIVIVKLSTEQLGPDAAGFVGAMIIWQVLEAARSRANIPAKNRRPFHIIADEFQTYMSTAFPILQEQARKYGVDTTVAHQIREQLDDGLRARVAGVGSLIVFQVTHANAEALAGEFKIEVPEPAVQRYEPKYAIVHNVLAHLAAHEHENSFVVEEFQEVRKCIDFIVEKAILELKGDASYSRYSTATTADYKLVEIRRADFESVIDRILYQAMTAKENLGVNENIKKLGLPVNWPELAPRFDRFYEDLIPLAPVIKSARRALLTYIPLMQRYDELTDVLGLYAIMPSDFSVFQECVRTLQPIVEKHHEEFPKRLKELAQKIDRAKEYPSYYPNDPFRWSLSGPVFEEWWKAYCFVQIELSLTNSVRFLMPPLQEKPCKAHVGQVEPIPDKPRLIADIKEEVAGTLTHLPPYHAHCKLVTEQGVEDFEIVTKRFTVPANPRLAADIKRHSQLLYGTRPRTIRRFGTIEGNGKSGDDEGVEFGEQKTARKLAKSRR